MDSPSAWTVQSNLTQTKARRKKIGSEKKLHQKMRRIKAQPMGMFSGKSKTPLDSTYLSDSATYLDFDAQAGLLFFSILCMCKLGPCATTSTHAAPPMWRNVDEDFDRVAKEMADANNQWKRLDDHPQLMDPSNKPPDSNGNPYIPGAAMFVSTTVNAGTIFVGKQGSGRWCEAH